MVPSRADVRWRPLHSNIRIKTLTSYITTSGTCYCVKYVICALAAVSVQHTYRRLSMSARTALKRMFKSYPLIANGMIYGSMWGLAEFSQQVITKKVLNANKPLEPINKGAIFRCVIVGSCVTSNILFFWYKWLDKRYIGNSGRIIVKKLLLDQFILTPPMLSAFFISFSILERKKDIAAEWKRKIIPTVEKAWLFWLPAQIVNFLFVPPTMRIVYISCCSFTWTNILCYIKRNDNLNDTHLIGTKYKDIASDNISEKSL